jgi:hypothetical protein
VRGECVEIGAKHLRGIVKPGDLILSQQGRQLPQGELEKFRRTSPREFAPADEIQNEGDLGLLPCFILGPEDL